MPCSESAGEHSGSHRYSAQAIVNSVGPYRFSTAAFGAASSHAAAEDTGSGSPQNRLQRKDGNRPGFNIPSCFIKTAVEGTENHMLRRISSTKAAGLINVF